MLDFLPVSLDKKEIIDSYSFKFGGGSCYHSFASYFCLAEQYGEMFCEYDNFLYILRSKICTKDERVYLFPLGERSNIKQALQNILDDAHENNSLVKFETLTKSEKEIVCELFPDKFTVETSDEHAEYVYSIERQEDLSRSGVRNRRQKINKFFREYGERCEILKIEKKHIPFIREFQSIWLKNKLESQERSQYYVQTLTENNTAARIALDNFFELGLCGIIIFIDGKVAGYEYGLRLSEDFCDSLQEKGDTQFRGIYRILNYEFIKLCCHGVRYLNVEEDLGIEGLRKKKRFDHPDLMLEKFILREVKS